MSREYLLYLEDMQLSCRKLLRYVNGLEFDQFITDERTYDAVILNLVILGEAAKHIPLPIGNVILVSRGGRSLVLGISPFTGILALMRRFSGIYCKRKFDIYCHISI